MSGWRVNHKILPTLRNFVPYVARQPLRSRQAPAILVFLRAKSQRTDLISTGRSAGTPAVVFVQVVGSLLGGFGII